MLSTKSERWNQASEHYLNENIMFDVLIEEMEAELHKYSIRANANSSIVRQKQQIIQQLRRYQSATLQAVLHSANLLHEVSADRLEKVEQIRNQNSLIELLKLNQDVK